MSINQSLPEDSKIAIFSQLSGKDLARAAQTCREWYHIITQNEYLNLRRITDCLSGAFLPFPQYPKELLSRLKKHDICNLKLNQSIQNLEEDEKIEALVALGDLKSAAKSAAQINDLELRSLHQQAIADAYLNTGNVIEAIKIANKIQDDVSKRLLFEEIVDALVRARKYEEAEKFISNSPQCLIKFLLAKAQSQVEAGELLEAAATFEEAKDINSSALVVKQAQFTSGFVIESGFYEIISEAQKNSDLANTQNFFIFLGKMYVKLGDFDKARKCFEKVKENCLPSNPGLYRHIQGLLAEGDAAVGHYARAKITARDIDHEPVRKQTLAQIASAQIAAELFHEAIKTGREAKTPQLVALAYAKLMLSSPQPLQGDPQV
ncbi:MAG: hypothetical protein S4CHLAM45_02360 [Chlamydiales bacterium]|nr:hypothetical protein [Chlamydiales bacterium]MCH9619095.1 hypothetical protein [Chlamydiales bacterium]MCH9622357.1 hypothetical protein [Chlamydiales bacterium]